MTHRHRLHDPVAIDAVSYRQSDGEIISFRGSGYPDKTLMRDLYLAVAQNTLMTCEEIFRAMLEIVCDPESAARGKFTSASPEVKRQIAAGHAEAKANAELLKLPTSARPRGNVVGGGIGSKVINPQGQRLGNPDALRHCSTAIRSSSRSERVTKFVLQGISLKSLRLSLRPRRCSKQPMQNQPSGPRPVAAQT
jgi:hypothetical protein